MDVFLDTVVLVSSTHKDFQNVYKGELDAYVLWPLANSSEIE
jgi:hypothetical protein